MSAALATVTADLDVARAVLATEAAALRALGVALDDGFIRAVDLLSGARAAWWSPAWANPAMSRARSPRPSPPPARPRLFVHPAEASHGDLGMIVPGDAVIALSNSGETAELAAIVAHARRFGLPLIASPRAPERRWPSAADVALMLPPAPEACPMGLAPTTSTTMQMALGDALAVALLTRRGFSAAGFPPVPSRRPARRTPEARARPDARGRGDAAGPPDMSMDRALL